MKTIEQLAREAGAAQDEGLTYFEANDLQRFHDAAIAQYRESLLAGVGVPVAEVSALYGGSKYQLLPTQDYYTADQLAAAVAIERERCAKAIEAEAHMFETLAAAKSCAAAIRGIMGAFDGLTKGSVPSKCEEYTYIPHQPSFRLTNDFTLNDLIKRFRHAESVCADSVYVPCSDKGFSDVRLDLWYADALIEHLKSKERA